MTFVTRSRIRWSFGLRAVESVKKCSWECFREGTKFRSVDVRLTSIQLREARVPVAKPENGGRSMTVLRSLTYYLRLLSSKTYQVSEAGVRSA